MSEPKDMPYDVAQYYAELDRVTVEIETALDRSEERMDLLLKKIEMAHCILRDAAKRSKQGSG